MWLIISSPNALQRKEDFVNEHFLDYDISSRILTVNSTFRMVSERKLHKKIEILKSSIDLEKKTGNEQLNYNTRSPKWADVFRYYLNLKA
ncbi:MAG: hypothetical protein ABJB76_02655 [Candidatus Nitrosocosmicus sp.]